MRLPLLLALLFAVTAQAAEKPNIIFILADDLGYGELGCYGQKLIQTPQLDRMAAEGLRFTQFYAGAPVCAPSRAVLMTGRNTGHVSVRGNAAVKDGDPPAKASKQTLHVDEKTIAEMLKGDGYLTALIGKWGIGDYGSGSEPNRRGFDHFYGYLNQKLAHNYYPKWLYLNERSTLLSNEVPEDKVAGSEVGGGVATKKLEYSPDLFSAAAQAWIEGITATKKNPFFLYLALTTPHANNEATRKTGNGQEVPDLGPYADKPWTDPNKGQAAMITRMDADIGRLFDLLVKLKIDDQTLVIFASDNGPHQEGGNDPAFFNASGGLRGIKRAVYEGGIRIPCVARWPGHISPGRTSTQAFYFGDFMTTFGELAQTPPPEGLDSVSLVPTLLNQSGQLPHEYLYWEFHEGGSSQAVLYDGHWKAVRSHPSAALELYDLNTDLAETHDLAATQPALIAKITDYLKTARQDNPDWPLLEPAR